MKKDHKSIIKEFLKKQKNKITIPFLKKDGKSANFIQKTIEILPKLLKKDKNEEIAENILVNLPKNENKTKATPKVVPNFTPSADFLIQKGQLKENILQSFAVLSRPTQNSDNQFKVESRPTQNSDNQFKVESRPTQNSENQFKVESRPTQNQNISLPKNTVSAKLSESSTMVGGADGAKLMPLRTYGSNKTLSLVGEAGKEKVDISTGSVIPLEKPKLSYSIMKPKTSKVNIISKDALGGVSSVVLPKYDTKQVLKMIENKQIDNPVKAENNELSIEVPAHFLGAIGKLAGTAAKGSAKAISKGIKNVASKAKAAVKDAIKDGTTPGQNNKASSLMSSTSQSSGVSISPATSPESGGIQQNDEMAQLDKARQSSNAFLESRQMTSSSLKSTGNQDLETDGAEPQEPSSESGGVGAAIGGIASGIGSAIGGIASGIGQGLGAVGGIMSGGGLLGMGIRALAGSKEKNSEAPVVTTVSSGAPVSITNVSYQYDVYRKTADDSFMLPNFRREYG